MSNLAVLLAIADCIPFVSVASSSPSIYMLALVEGIKLHNTKSVYTASIKFGGWADNATIEKKKNELDQILKELKLKPSEKIQFLGYNPPYQLINRRNEVLIELADFDPERIKEFSK